MDSWAPTIVSDEAVGRGSLMGIVSSLVVSPDELCFVAVCDIPGVNIDLVRSTVRQADDWDAVVSHCGRPEPLSAVYRKGALAVFERMPVSGRLRISKSAVPPGQSDASQVGG